MPIDPKSLPRDAETLLKIVVDLAEQLDRSLAEQNKFQTLLRELLEAQRNRKSERFGFNPERSDLSCLGPSGLSFMHGGRMEPRSGIADNTSASSVGS